MTKLKLKKILAAQILLIYLVSANHSLAADAGGTLWRGATYMTLIGIGVTNMFQTDLYRFTIGSGLEHDLHKMAIELRWNLTEPQNFLQAKLNGFLEFGYESWQELAIDRFTYTNRGNLMNISPGIRLEWDNFLLTNFVDMKIGVGILGPSKLKQNNGNVVDLGGALTFSEMFALGGFIGEEKKWQYDLAIYHSSNHNIYVENDGINFYNVSVGYNY